MRAARKALVILGAALMLALAMTGCYSKSVDELYALPQLSEGYLQLQEKINGLLAEGAEYAAPTAGSYRQAVQLADIDGDGVAEAVAFFAKPGDDKPLKVYVFRRGESGYEEAAVIEGEGTSIESIGFPDLNGDGMLELAVGWKLSADVNMLSVYTMSGYLPSRIISTDYQEYTIAGISGRDDIIVFRLSGSELTGEAELYTMEADGEIVNTNARLSTGIEALLRIRNSTLASGEKAVYVEGTIDGGGIVTDILAYRGRRIANITRDDAVGTSTETVRSYAVYCRDVNGDGVLDVPVPVLLPAQSETTSYYMTEWYAYYRSGRRELVETTYHNYSDGWYLKLPEAWRGNVTVRREDAVSGERAIIFSEMEGDEVGRDFLAIYALSGANRHERARAAGRFVLQTEDSVTYAANILGDITGASLRVDADTVKANFDIIYSEWATGDI